MIRAAKKRAPLHEGKAANIAAIETFSQRVSRKTEFLFVRVALTSGAIGWGEATFNALNGQVMVAMRILAERIDGRSLQEARSYLDTQPCWKHGRAFRVAVNALRTAMLDAEAHQLDLPLHALLGEQLHTTIKCYGNINRGTSDRSATGWADRAARALKEGHTAIKLAPFEQVSGGDGAARLHAAGAGIDASIAVRERVGDTVDLMLDCHWRFDEQSALGLLDRLAAVGPTWIEAPVQEDFEAIPELQRIRKAANARQIDLAGGEFHEGLRGWSTFLRQNVYDTANPDLRFCGPEGMIQIAKQAAGHGIGFAPHNHLGPVMAAASLHAMAVAPTAQFLELQHAESDVAPCMTDPSVLAPQCGHLSVPTTAGLGITIETKALESVRLD